MNYKFKKELSTQTLHDLFLPISFHLYHPGALNRNEFYYILGTRTSLNPNKSSIISENSNQITLDDVKSLYWLPAHYQKFSFGRSRAHALPDIHGEQRASAVKHWRQRTHQCSHHWCQHQTFQSWSWKWLTMILSCVMVNVHH